MKEENAILEFKEEYRFLSNSYNCPVWHISYDDKKSLPR